MLKNCRQEMHNEVNEMLPMSSFGTVHESHGSKEKLESLFQRCSVY